MIDVTVSLVPGGVEALAEGIARVVIYNDDTGDSERGNYRWAISHQFNSGFGARAAARTGIEHPTAHDLLEHGAWCWKQGTVVGFKRQRGVVALLAAVMKAAGL